MGYSHYLVSFSATINRTNTVYGLLGATVQGKDEQYAIDIVKQSAANKCREKYGNVQVAVVVLQANEVTKEVYDAADRGFEP